ncbi:MAG: hypothetical protein ACYDHM_09425 [Acidiferrobacterales bacterium]
MKLTVQCAAKEDVYKDILRVPEQHRLDARGHVIPEGSVCKIMISDRMAYGIVRGASRSLQPEIHMDERLRNLLHVEVSEKIEVLRFSISGEKIKIHS